MVRRRQGRDLYDRQPSVGWHLWLFMLQPSGLTCFGAAAYLRALKMSKVQGA